MGLQILFFLTAAPLFVQLLWNGLKEKQYSNLACLFIQLKNCSDTFFNERMFLSCCAAEVTTYCPPLLPPKMQTLFTH